VPDAQDVTKRVTLLGRHNSIAKHEARAQIERDLAIGIPLRRLAKKYGVSKDALCRHRKRLPPQLKAAMLAQSLRPEVDLDKLRTTESEGLLATLAAQRARLLLWQDNAAAAEQFSVAAQLAAQIHNNLALVGRYLDELSTHHTVTSVSVLVSAEYLELRTSLLRSLQPYPDARRAVAAALHRIESEAAQRPPQRVLEAIPNQPAEATHAAV
jgi:hypothetical protein